VLARYLEADGQGGFRPNEQAATELEKLAPSADELVTQLADPQVEVRRAAAYALLGLFDPARSEQRAALTALLSDPDQTIRGLGLAAIKQMPAEDQAAALPQLAAMLDHQRERRADNRASVARLIGGLKSAGAAQAPALLVAVRADPEGKVRAACLAAVSQIAPATEVVGPLAAALADKDPAVRIVASAQLRRLGAASAPAASQLATALGDSDQRVRENSADALIVLGAPAVPALSGALGSDKVEARKYALAALAKIGPPAKSAIPAVEKCLQDSDPAVSKLAAQALKQIGAP
jgi:HEAT repeat protein